MPRLDHTQEMSALLLAHVCRRADWIGDRSMLAETTRAAALVLEAGEFLQTEDAAHGHAIAGLLERLLRPRCAPSRAPAAALDARQVALLTALDRHVRALLVQPGTQAAAPGAPWEATVVSEASQRVPTMLTEETRQFYTWLASQVSPEAHLVELGAWLGSSTRCLCEGLGRTAGARQSIDVYDSFVWAPWMDQYIARTPGDRWPNLGESFLGLFNDAVRDYEHQIITHPSWIDDGMPHGGRPAWPRREPIELLIYDMGPDRPVLDAMWETFSPFFQRGTTVVVFNEYGKVHSSALWEFCDAHADCLRPHYKPNGSPKGFLYV